MPVQRPARSTPPEPETSCAQWPASDWQQSVPIAIHSFCRSMLQRYGHLIDQVLCAFPSGTGKTLAAEAIGFETGKPLKVWRDR